MMIEHHPEGVTLQRPAVVIRGARLSVGGPGAPGSGGFGEQSRTRQAEEGACPKCGQRGFSCCSYADSAQLSSEGRTLYASTLGGAEANARQVQQAGAEQQSGQRGPAPAAEGMPTSTRPVEAAAERHGGGQSGTEGDSHQHGDRQEGREGREGGSASGAPSTTRELSEEEKEEVRDLQERDREVRQHEQAHAAAAGHLARGGPRYEYESGPDGRQYATGGDVKIAVGGGNTPEERLRNAKQAERAATAPAEPSPQDRKVAAEARKAAAEAEKEIAEKRAAESGSGMDSAQSGDAPSAAGNSSAEGAASPPASGAPELDTVSGRSGDDEDRTATPLDNTGGRGGQEGALSRAAEAYRSQSGATTGRSYSLEAGALPGSLLQATA